MGRGDFGAARSVFERMVSGNPRDAFAWWGYALASMNLGAWPEAHRAASRAAELDSTNQAARQAMLQLEQAHPELAASPR